MKLCLSLSLLVSSSVVESEPQCLRQLCKPQRDKGEETQHMRCLQHVRSVLTRKHKSGLFAVNRNSGVGTVMDLHIGHSPVCTSILNLSHEWQEDVKMARGTWVTLSAFELSQCVVLTGLKWFNNEHHAKLCLGFWTAEGSPMVTLPSPEDFRCATSSGGGGAGAVPAPPLPQPPVIPCRDVGSSRWGVGNHPAHQDNISKANI